MNLTFIQFPNDTYTIDVQLNTNITPLDIENTGKLAGRLVKNYLITPKQAALITSIACAIFALIAAFILSPIFVILSLTLSTLGFVYYFKERDIYSKRIRQKMADQLSQVPVLELVQDKQRFKDLFDYDLARYSEATDRAKYYVMLARLQTLFITIIKRRFEFEYKIQQTTQEIERQLEGKYQTLTGHLKTALLQSKNELQALEEKAQEKRQPILALEARMRQIRTLYANQLYTDQLKQEPSDQASLSLEASHNLDSQILLFPALEKQLTEAKVALEQPLKEIEDQKAQISRYENDLTGIDRDKTEGIEKIESWRKKQLAAIATVTQQAFDTLVSQFKKATPYLQADQIEPV